MMSEMSEPNITIKTRQAECKVSDKKEWMGSANGSDDVSKGVSVKG